MCSIKHVYKFIAVFSSLIPCQKNGCKDSIRHGLEKEVKNTDYSSSDPG